MYAVQTDFDKSKTFLQQVNIIFWTNSKGKFRVHFHSEGNKTDVHAPKPKVHIN